MAYQIDGDNELERMHVKFSPYGQTGYLAASLNIIKEFLAIRRAISLNKTFVLFC